MSTYRELTDLITMFNTEGWRSWLLPKFERDRANLINLMVYGGATENREVAESIKYLDSLIKLEDNIREQLVRLQKRELDPDAPADPEPPKIRAPIDFSDEP